MAVSIYPGVASSVTFAGQPVVAVYAGALGGRITNPYLAIDQGIAIVEPLFIDLVNPAGLSESATTFPLQPGESFFVPSNLTDNISVNAATAGHSFSVIVVQPATPYPPVPPQPSAFPPIGPLSVLGYALSYLYVEYNDDDDLQAFVGSYNSIAQGYLDWFNTINLPIYTSDTISGDLLDWIAQGLYGQTRPALSSGQNAYLGTYNSFLYNQIPYNERLVVGPSNVVATSDDIFKRCMTWNLYQGDGRQFNVLWLKRRIMRWLTGENGTSPNIDNTDQISVTFGVGNQIAIRLLTQTVNVTGALYNGFAYNGAVYNSWIATPEFDYPPLPNAEIFVEAFQAGVLQLPFLYSFSISGGG